MNIKVLSGGQWAIVLASLMLVGSIAMTYHRAFISQDYKIFYEAPCDPALKSCFVALCEDGADSDCAEYYYLKIERSASELAEHCGTSIVDCVYANACTEETGIQCIEHYCEGDLCQ